MKFGIELLVTYVMLNDELFITESNIWDYSVSADQSKHFL